jgi:hypothetical protein
MDKIADVIAMFDTSWDRQAIRPIPPRRASRWGGKGLGKRAAIHVINNADMPLSATEMAREAYRYVGKEMPHNNELRLVGVDFIKMLKQTYGDRLLCIEGKPRRWRVAPNPQ